MEIDKVWHDATESVKDKVMHPTLWRALDLAVPVTLEGDSFVVGFGAGSMHMAGHLTASQHRNMIEAGLASSAGKKLNLVVIEGTTQDDWASHKARQRAAEEARTRVRERVAQEHQATQSWDGVLEQVSRSYSQLQLRQLPQVRASYIEQAIVLISDAMDQLYDEENPDETAQRALARVIDRVGVNTDTPPALIAWELTKYRKTR